jgi:hypothetical protein
MYCLYGSEKFEVGKIYQTSHAILGNQIGLEYEIVRRTKKTVTLHDLGGNFFTRHIMKSKGWPEICIPNPKHKDWFLSPLDF